MRKLALVPLAVLALLAAVPAAARPPGLAPLPPSRAHLDRQTRAIVEAQAAIPYVDLMTLPPAARRQGQDQFFGPLGLASSAITGIEERLIPSRGGSLRIRIYRPRSAGKTVQPALVYFHGGGMSMGSLEQYEGLTQRLAARSGVTVIAVDYRLTPEHRFPAPLEDAYDALSWAHAHAAELGLDPNRIAVGGDSAGGNLAAALTQLARQQGGPPIRFQLLIYPAVGTTGHSRSMRRFATGYLFGANELREAIEEYVPDPAQRTDWRAMPINQTDYRGLPPAFIVSAQYEIMRDDIEEYGARLRRAGVPVEVHRYSGTVHPFLSMAKAIPAGRQAIDECADKLRRAMR